MAEDVKAETGGVVDLTEDTELGATPKAAVQTAPVEESGSTWRRVLGVILAILAMITLVLAVEALWLKTTLEDEDTFVETFAPVAQQTAVATAISTRVADGLVESEEFQVFVTDGLPPDLGVLAIPITAAVREVVVTGGTEIVQSDVFATVWEGALRVTHTAASAVLTGNDGALVSEGGVVSIDLNEIAATISSRLQEERGIDLPEIEADLGSIVLLESDQLAAAQDVLGVISALAWVLPLIALVLIIGAVWVHPDNRWMVAFIAFGTAIVGLLSLVFLRVVESTVLGSITDRESGDAFDATFDTVTAGLRSAIWALITLTLIVGFFAWINGPSHAAHRLRSSITGTVDDWRKDPEEEPGALAQFLAEWKRTIQVIVVLLGLAFIVFGPSPSGLSVLLTALVVLGIGVLVEVVAGSAEAPALANEKVDA